MKPNEGAEGRRHGRYEPSRLERLARLEKEAPLERRWRRRLAAVAISALALSGISTMAAAPALADEAVTAEGESSTAVSAPSDDATGTGETAEADVAEADAEADVAEGDAEADVAEAPAATEAPASAPAPVDTQAPADEPDPAAPLADTAPAPPAADAALPAAAAAEASAPVVFLVPPGDEPVDNVEICHATASHTNPYVTNEPAANGNVSGHADHTGPIWFPGIEEEWGDIIPPFFYEDPDGVHFFPGLNWTAEGQAIYANDCVIPPPVLTITPMACPVFGSTGELAITLGPLQSNGDYRLTIFDSEGEIVEEIFPSAADGTFEDVISLPPGDYTITLEQSIEGEWELLDEQAFTIGACPPEITVVVTECPAAGGTGSALLTLSGLVEGVEYEVKVTDRGDADGIPYGGIHVVMGGATGTAQLTISSLPADREYTAWVNGVIDSLVLSDSVDFSLKPCPPAPVVPEKPTKVVPAKVVPPKVVPPKTLPRTGASGIEEMLFGSMLLIGLGGAALVAARRRQSGDHHVN